MYEVVEEQFVRDLEKKQEDPLLKAAREVTAEEELSSEGPNKGRIGIRIETMAEQKA